MNPYIAAGLSMCGVLLFALIGTAYLAVYFNRRAKADMKAQLEPLAEVIQGEVDIEEAEIKGKWDGTIAIGRVTGAEGGAGRVFQTDIIDSAGGDAWRYRSIAHKDGPSTSEFDSDRQDLRIALDEFFATAMLETVAKPEKHWFWIQYDPAGGFVRLTLPMQTRRDMPDVEAFKRNLVYLRNLGERNRSLQEASQEVSRDASRDSQ